MRFYIRSAWVRCNYSAKTRFMAYGDYLILGRKQIIFGSNFSFGRGFWCQAIQNNTDDAKITFGNNFICSQNVHIGAAQLIKIGSNVLVGSNVLIIDHNHGDTSDFSQRIIAPNQRPLTTTGPIVIGDNVWICDNVTILGGSQIGNGAIIGVGSIVSGHIPENAKVISQRCQD